MGLAHCAIVVTIVFAYTVQQLVESPPFPDMSFEQLTRARASSGSDTASTALLLWRLLAASVTGGLTCLMLNSTEANCRTFKCRRSGKEVSLCGTRSFTTFTCLSWAAQTVYFALVAAASLFAMFASPSAVAAASASPLGAAVAQFAWVLHDLTLAGALLVTTVTTFVLYPLAKAYNMMHLISSWPALVMHHWNVVNVLGEFYLNDVPVLASHFHISLLWGLFYVVFAFFWFRKTGIYYYVFLDYRKVWAPIAYVMVMGVLYYYHSLIMRISTYLGK
jgi:hypothetical protein